MLVIGTGGDDDKERFLTDFDSECTNAQIIFSTPTITDGGLTVGVNFKRNVSACVVWWKAVAPLALARGSPVIRGRAAREAMCPSAASSFGASPNS